MTSACALLTPFRRAAAACEALGPRRTATLQAIQSTRCSALLCFRVTHACGTERCIDDGKKSGGHLATQYTERFRMPNAYAPALAARLLHQAGRDVGLDDELIWQTLDLPVYIKLACQSPCPRVGRVCGGSSIAARTSVGHRRVAHVLPACAKRRLQLSTSMLSFR